MKNYPLAVLVLGVSSAAALALALSARAQEPAPAPKAETPMAAPMADHHKDSAARAEREADMRAECQELMANKQEMQDKLQAMDVKLDELVAEMNAASTSEAPDAMEKPMAAVITELVAQRKATRSMMMEIQPEMMAHMMRHRDMHRAKGAMDCPMMKAGKTPEPKAEETKPKD